MEFEQMTLANLARLLAAIKQLKPDDPNFVQQVIDRGSVPDDFPHPRVTVGSLLKLLEQTNGSTILPDDIVALIYSKTKAQSLIGYATVEKVKKQPPKPEDFEQPGTRVRLCRDSMYAFQNSGEGVVTGKSSDGKDCVTVKWLSDDHERYYYRTGKTGQGDLELVNQSQSPTIATVTIKTMDGEQSFEVSIPANHPVQPVEVGDIVKIDLATMQIVAG